MALDRDLTIEFMDKTDYVNTLINIAGEREHSLAAMMAERHKMLNELLASLCSEDARERVKEIGFKAATRESIEVIAALKRDAEVCGPKWIPVSESEPENSDAFYWVALSHGEIVMCYYNNYKAFSKTAENCWQDLEGNDFSVNGTSYIEIKEPKR